MNVGEYKTTDLVSYKFYVDRFSSHTKNLADWDFSSKHCLERYKTIQTNENFSDICYLPESLKVYKFCVETLKWTQPLQHDFEKKWKKQMYDLFCF